MSLGKGQGMAALFVPDPEIAASLAPFFPVRVDPAPPRTRLRQQMRELVAERAIYLRRAVLAQARIERDELGAKISPARGRAQLRIPLDAHAQSELAGAHRLQKLARALGERDVFRPNRMSGVSQGRDRGENSRQAKLELFNQEHALPAGFWSAAP